MKGIQLLAATMLMATGAFMPANSFGEGGDSKKETALSVRKYMSQARIYSGKGYYALAEENYLQVLELNSKHFKANYELGELYFYKMHRKPDAVKHFESALGNMPKDTASVAELLFFSGQAYHFVADYDNALQCYNRFKRYIDDNKDGQELRKEVAKAERECRKGIAMHEDFRFADVKVENMGSNINSVYAEYVPVVNRENSTLMYTARRKFNTGGQKDYKDEKYYEDMFISFKASDGEFGRAQRVDRGSELVANLTNTEYHEALVGMSYDENILLTYRERALWVSEFKEDQWSKPQKLSNMINAGEFQPHASISADNNRIFFSSNMEGSHGNLDIYMAEKQSNGRWGAPKNLGKMINTRFSEDSPEISEDGKTLYFASKGHDGIGGYDIFKSEFKNGAWTKAENLGIPINSSADDIYYKIGKAEEWGYFASSREGGFGDMDIYFAKFGAYPVFDECSPAVAGAFPVELNVKDYVKQVDPGKIYQWDMGDGGYAEGSTINYSYSAPGLYSVKLNAYNPKNRKTKFVKDNIKLTIDNVNNFNFSVRDTVGIGENVAFDGSTCMVKNARINHYFWKFEDGSEDEKGKSVVHVFEKTGRQNILLEVDYTDTLTNIRHKKCISKSIDVLDAMAYKEYMSKEEAKVEETALALGRGFANADEENTYLSRLSLEPIYFDFNRTSIRKDAKRILDRNVVKLKDMGDAIIKISAHTDSRGSMAYNLKLSERRAKSVVNYLIRHGIPRSRIAAVVSSGESDLVNKCTDDASCTRRQHQMNRRAEFVVIGRASKL